MAIPDYNRLHASLDDSVRHSAAATVPILLELLQPKSVVDIGCGTGLWLAEFQLHGLDDFLGLDGEFIDRSTMQIPRERFQPANLNEPFNMNRVFDLAVCLEVAEHIPAAAADSLVDSLVKAAPAVFFSAAIPGQGGAGHTNEQWPSFWREKFQARGFVAFDSVRRRIWNNPDVLDWYAQNSLLYVSETALGKYPFLTNEPRDFLVDVVHPRRYRTLDRTARAGEAPSLGFLAKSVPGAAARFVKARLGIPLNLREPSHG